MHIHITFMTYHLYMLHTNLVRYIFYVFDISFIYIFNCFYTLHILDSFYNLLFYVFDISHIYTFTVFLFITYTLPISCHLLISSTLSISYYFLYHVLCKFPILSCSFPFHVPILCMYHILSYLVYFHITYLILSCTFIYILIFFIYGTFVGFHLILFMYCTFICLLPVSILFHLSVI